MRGWLALVIVTACVAVASAQPRDKKRADKLFEDGRRYLAAKEYALACTAFEQSQAADPAIGTLLNIALCYEDWGHLAAAYRAYLEAEKFAGEKKDKRAKGAHTKVEQLGPMVPHLQLDVPADADPGAVFLLDGKEIDRAGMTGDLLVEIGSHTVEARVSGKPPKLTTVDVKLGEHRHLVVEVPKPEVAVKVVVAPPPARNRTKLIGGLTLGGVGVVAVGFAGYVALVARQDYENAVKDCPNTICTNHDAYEITQRARRRANYMSIVTGAGFAAVGVGIYLVLTSRETRESKVTVMPTSDGLGLAIGGRL
jgi:tetratricopeptide (TPR) repeat protein